MKDGLQFQRWMIAVNFAVAVVCGVMALWFLRLSEQAAAETILRYGRNIDSGAIEEVVAKLYLAPAAVIFALVALIMWRAWKLRWFAQGVAVAWVICPVMLIGLAWWLR